MPSHSCFRLIPKNVINLFRFHFRFVFIIFSNNNKSKWIIIIGWQCVQSFSIVAGCRCDIIVLIFFLLLDRLSAFENRAMIEETIYGRCGQHLYIYIFKLNRGKRHTEQKMMRMAWERPGIVQLKTTTTRPIDRHMYCYVWIIAMCFSFNDISEWFLWRQSVVRLVEHWGIDSTNIWSVLYSPSSCISNVHRRIHWNRVVRLLLV